eukprot:tig00020693_g13032.t1
MDAHAYAEYRLQLQREKTTTTLEFVKAPPKEKSGARGGAAVVEPPSYSAATLAPGSAPELGRADRHLEPSRNTEMDLDLQGGDNEADTASPRQNAPARPRKLKSARGRLSQGDLRQPRPKEPLRSSSWSGALGGIRNKIGEVAQSARQRGKAYYDSLRASVWPAAGRRAGDDLDRAPAKSQESTQEPGPDHEQQQPSTPSPRERGPAHAAGAGGGAGAGKRAHGATPPSAEAKTKRPAWGQHQRPPRPPAVPALNLGRLDEIETSADRGAEAKAKSPKSKLQVTVPARAAPVQEEKPAAGPEQSSDAAAAPRMAPDTVRAELSVAKTAIEAVVHAAKPSGAAGAPGAAPGREPAPGSESAQLQATPAAFSFSADRETVISTSTATAVAPEPEQDERDHETSTGAAAGAAPLRTPAKTPAKPRTPSTAEKKLKTPTSTPTGVHPHKRPSSSPMLKAAAPDEGRTPERPRASGGGGGGARARPLSAPPPAPASPGTPKQASPKHSAPTRQAVVVLEASAWSRPGVGLLLAACSPGAVLEVLVPSDGPTPDFFRDPSDRNAWAAAERAGRLRRASGDDALSLAEYALAGRAELLGVEARPAAGPRPSSAASPPPRPRRRPRPGPGVGSSPGQGASPAAGRRVRVRVRVRRRTARTGARGGDLCRR